MQRRFEVLDGWRGIGILLVIAGHWFPLGPAKWGLNESIPASAMVIFFIMSGFLITTSLVRDQNIASFLIRRLVRIVPLAWLLLLFVLWFNHASVHEWLSNLFFYANLPPIGLVTGAQHFWSLCLEVQFYLIIAVLVKAFDKKAFLLLPIMSFLITAWRVYNGEEVNIRTYYRVDEVLAGCMLALLYISDFSRIKVLIGKLNTPLLFAVMIASASAHFSWLNYLRPYLGLLVVGSTIFTTADTWWIGLLKSKIWLYIASISYALYLFHGVLGATWLGQGGTVEKYMKRPILAGVTLLLAHLSTYYYESYWIAQGKKWSRRFKQQVA